MTDSKNGYPAIVLLVGAMSALLWVVGLDLLFEFGTAEIIFTLTTGGVASASASLTTMYLWLSNRSNQQQQEREAHEAKHDALTGLINRAELFRVLDDSIVEAQNQDMVLGVLFLDLDRFKVVNDSMGHEVGDDLLRIVAQRLKASVRATDVVARLGGDEFVVLCRDLLSADSVVATAKQILRKFEDPVALAGQDHRIGTSIGVSIVRPGDDRKADELIRDADAAMYRAKATRSGFSVFDEEQRLEVADRLQIERDLRLALENNELSVNYQPIVDIANGKLYAFEALVRWEHAERGHLSPADFLSVAEETGMMGKIGEYVLREACSQLAIWRHSWPGAANVRVSVNVAEQQLVDASLADKVIDTVNWAGLTPESLILEITEDVMVGHLDGMSSLRDLQRLGIKLSIDDFGTGRSSLEYIKQFDMVSSLKIDKSFVKDMESGQADRAIINAVVAISTDLGLRVIAEGVESEAQCKKLHEMGIDLIQGYLFSKPVPANKINPSIWFPHTKSPVS